MLKKEYKIELAPTLTGHWYNVWEMPTEKFLGVFPSSTTILNAYPQSQHLTKWIAEQGWQESQKIKSDAGVSGTTIHNACDLLEQGALLKRENYSLEEWFKISTFINWHKEVNPKLIAIEVPVFSKKGKYAGRADRLYTIEDEYVLVDFKSSRSLYPHFPLQFASYAQAIEENSDIKISKTAALQLGTSSKKGFKFDEHPDWREHYKVFKHVMATWQYDYFGSKKNPKEPPVLNLPDELSL